MNSCADRRHLQFDRVQAELLDGACAADTAISNESAAREHDRPQRDRLADALAGRLARLALAGYLKLEDPDCAARQFLALVTYDTQRLDEEELAKTLAANVRFFLRCYAAGGADS